MYTEAMNKSLFSEYYTICDNILRGVIFLYILVGSIPTATRLKKLIEASAGYPADVVHTPAEINPTGGCSYCVRTDNRLSDIIRPLCSDYGVRIRSIYIDEIKDGERVFNAVP